MPHGSRFPSSGGLGQQAAPRIMNDFRPESEQTMSITSVLLHNLLAYWGVITAVLTILVIYWNTLSTREADELYLNKTEEIMIGQEQGVVIRKMNHLKPIIIVFAVISGMLLLSSYVVWVWTVFERS
jgi:succinate dehydrogenase/fumarate reductase cytochrome b subunit